MHIKNTIKSLIIGMLIPMILSVTGVADSMTKMYSPDGRSIEVNSEEVEEYKNVGWYTYPVKAMYSLDGRCENVILSEVESWKNVGWYTKNEYEAAKKLQSIGNQFKYIDYYKDFIKGQGDNWQCSPPVTENELFNILADFKPTDRGNFEDAYMLDVDDDDIPELVALFSHPEYGKAEIYKYVDGYVYHQFDLSAHDGRRTYSEDAYIMIKNEDVYIFNMTFASYYPVEYKVDGIFESNCNGGLYKSGVWQGTDTYYLTSDKSEIYKVNGVETTSEKCHKEIEKMYDVVYNLDDGDELINLRHYHYVGMDISEHCDQPIEQNLCKFIIPIWFQEINNIVPIANQNSITDLISIAFSFYQNGYNYEAIQISENIKKINGITDSQITELNDIIEYCNNSLNKAIRVQLDNIQNMYASGMYYETIQEATKVLQNNSITSEEKKEAYHLCEDAKAALEEYNISLYKKVIETVRKNDMFSDKYEKYHGIEYAVKEYGNSYYVIESVGKDGSEVTMYSVNKFNFQVEYVFSGCVGCCIEDNYLLNELFCNCPDLYTM